MYEIQDILEYQDNNNILDFHVQEEHLAFKASDMELTIGSGSYSILISFRAFAASCSLFAATIAIGSPKYLTLSFAIGGLSLIIDPTNTGVYNHQ